MQALGADRLDHEIIGAGAHGGDDRLDRAVRGLDDDRRADLALPHSGEHAHAVEIGHDEIENQQINRRTFGALESRERLIAAFDRLGLVAEAPDHGFEKPALNGIVVGNQYGRNHQVLLGR